MNQTLDQVTLVDAQDNVVGVYDKVLAHRGEAMRHRAISVFLWNHSGELLIQQRSATKIVGAGLWANTCCGNLRPGEEYITCARRRLLQELGIVSVELQPLDKFEYHVRCGAEFSEWEIDQIYWGKYDGQVNLNPSEVQAFRWISVTTLAKEFSKDSLMFVPWLPILLKQPKLAQEWRAHE